MQYKLKVIYDAAHAFGETMDGKGVAEFGDASMFSFHATKVFHSIEGGAVTFRNEKLAGRLYELKNFGKVRNPRVFLQLSLKFLVVRSHIGQPRALPQGL